MPEKSPQQARQQASSQPKPKEAWHPPPQTSRLFERQNRLIQLQRTRGNRAVGQMLKDKGMISGASSMAEAVESWTSVPGVVGSEPDERQKQGALPLRQESPSAGQAPAPDPGGKVQSSPADALAEIEKVGSEVRLLLELATSRLERFMGASNDIHANLRSWEKAARLSGMANEFGKYKVDVDQCPFGVDRTRIDDAWARVADAATECTRYDFEAVNPQKGISGVKKQLATATDAYDEVMTLCNRAEEIRNKGWSLFGDSGAAKAAQMLDHPVNFNRDRAQDYAAYGALGGAAAAGAASASASVIQKGMGGEIPNLYQGASSAAQAVSVLGAAGGILSVGSDLIDANRGRQVMAQSSLKTGDRVMGGGGMLLSGTAGAVKDSATSAVSISKLAGNGAAMAGATLAAGGAAVAMGTVDMVRGSLGAYKARHRMRLLNGLAKDSKFDQVSSAAKQAASTQNMRVDSAIATTGKGALLVAGGVTLLVLGSNPVGWGLLAGAAIVGGIAALWKFWTKRKRKKEVAIRELGIQKERADWKARVEQVEHRTTLMSGHRADRSRQLQALGPDPLERELLKRNYPKDGWDKFYSNYIHDTAQSLYLNGVVRGDLKFPLNQEMRKVVEEMGFKVEPAKGTPKAEEIGKALHN